MKKLWKPALLLAAMLVMAFGMINSGAWWTDSESTQTQAIKSGTLKLLDTGFTSFDLGTIDNMAPGDFTNEVHIIIENDGTIPLAWFGDLVVSNSILKDVIYIDHAKMEFLYPNGAAKWEPVDEFIIDGKGAGQWPTNWTGFGGLATLAAFDGNAGMAPTTKYEFMGALKPDYKYRLTLRFGFYEGAGNSYQAAGPLNLSFAVDATQVNAGALTALGPTLGNHFTWMTQQLDKQGVVAP